MAVNDAVLSKAFASPDLWNATRQWWAARQAPVSWPFFLRLSEVLALPSRHVAGAGPKLSRGPVRFATARQAHPGSS